MLSIRIHLVWLGAALLAACPPSAFAETLTAQAVEQRVAARHPKIIAAERAAAAAEARAEQFSLLPNPSLGWEREAFPGAEREDVFRLTLPLELSARRATGRELSRSQAGLVRAEAALTQSAVRLGALSLFYEALAAERQAAVLGAALQRLEEAGRVISERREQGVVSGYDASRLEVQLELGRAAHEQAEAHSAALRAELARLLGLELGSLELSGTLAVASPGERRAPRRALREARQAGEAAGRAGQAAGRAWIPSLELSGGLRIGESDQTRYGYVAGVSVELPLFSRGQELGAEASAQQRFAQAHAAALEQDAARAELAAEHELGAALAELTRLRGVAAERAAKVLRAAESSYREGARSLLELLDAQALVTELELRALAAELRAKLAELELRAARGEFE